jgi:hypothetical protein
MAGITRTEHSADELRAVASKCRDGAQVRRLLALAFVLDDAYLGGERTGGKRGRGAPGKTAFVAASKPRRTASRFA